MTALLDVNALIALVDPEHTGHQAIRKWFMRHHGSGWATCPITENGMVRVLSQSAYPGGRRTPAEVIQILTELKDAFADSHEFWADGLSITDDSVFDRALIAGSLQVTDVYLLGLAARRNVSMVSFDLKLAWQGVRGGSARLVQRPAPLS